MACVQVNSGPAGGVVLMQILLTRYSPLRNYACGSCRRTAGAVLGAKALELRQLRLRGGWGRPVRRHPRAIIATHPEITGAGPVAGPPHRPRRKSTGTSSVAPARRVGPPRPAPPASSHR